MQKILESEIVREKKEFIFNVNQTSNYVFPNEEYKYMVFIKNISGDDIENFNIRIEAPDGVFIDKIEGKPDTPISIKDSEIKLYEIKAKIETIGEYIVHFIGYGDETKIGHKALKIKCSRSYNSDKLLHRIHIYDFTPYENNFSMEADNYSDEVVQTFKRQKLPYKAGKQPFRFIKTVHPENIESESYLQQNDEAKNSKEEHVYQYITRENFTDDSIEDYEGENLFDLINQINEKSKYFNATFLGTGTNTLLNDFTQYSPNGFIYRMGLLTSEIYHTLGVIPTYSYMSDRLFRWAPSPSGQRIFHDRDIDEMDSFDNLLNLYPKPKSMNWDENIWVGRTWIVYKKPTEKYQQTDEFKEKFENKLISYRENIGSFDSEKDAEMFVEQKEYFDEVIRNQIQDSLVKYEYEIREEGFYDTGVFFVNIPINKIPSNYYLPDSESLYNIINRAKPYGVKPIVNYIVEKNFDLDMSLKMIPNYYREVTQDLGEVDLKYYICQNKFIYDKIKCNNEMKQVVRELPTNCVFYNNDFDMNVGLKVDYSNVGIDFDKNNPFEMTLEEDNTMYGGVRDQDFKKIIDIIELLYNNNYNNISFRIPPQGFTKFPSDSLNTFSTIDDYIVLNKSNDQSISIDGIKLPVSLKYEEENLINSISIKDSFDRVHILSAQYDQEEELYNIKYSYKNNKGQKSIRREGLQNIKGLIIGIGQFNNRKILIFMIEDSEDYIHYFAHTIVENIVSVEKESKNSLWYRSSILGEPISLETPFCYCVDKHSPKIIGGENWTNIYRLNENEKSFSYIENHSQNSITPNDIFLYFDDINIPKTSIVKSVKLDIKGNSSQIPTYLYRSIGKNYLVENVDGYSLQLKPQKMVHYSQKNESNDFYQIKLDQATKKEQETLIEYYTKLINENIIFNEDVDSDVYNYMNNYEDFITISKGYWNELSDFTDLTYNLNETTDITFTIEGFNDGNEVDLLSQIVYGLDQSSVVKERVPEGYFFLEIPLLYSNDFLLNLLKVRFRFYDNNHDIKIFNTTLNVTFKNKQEDIIPFEFLEEKVIQNNDKITVLNQYLFPQELNNGIAIKLSFDDLNSGDFYHINQASLKVIYQDTDVELMINKHKYRYIPIGESQSTIFGKVSEDSFPSGEFYNDISSISQIESTVGIENKGIELQDAVFQQFETRDDNITSVELFPNGFVGNPDELLKIGIYTNNENTPGKLIKEVYANGWTKNNEELKSLPSIKYNLNIDNLKINEKYWIKIEVLNPKDNSYYLLKSVNRSLPRHKLLYRKNNNYINTFSSLTFNIYSKNLSKSFRKLPTVQEFFDNPYMMVGLHRGQGSISNLETIKWVFTVKEEDHMKEYFEEEPEFIVDDLSSGIGIFIKKSDNSELQANFEKNQWDPRG